MKTLNGLTGLRFLAALYVFFFHMQMRLGLSFLPAPISTFVSQGALGVNVFFVLSGFILTYAHIKDFTSPSLPSWVYYKYFMLKRFARIYPAYFIGLLLCILVIIVTKTIPICFVYVLALDATLLESFVPKLSMAWYGSGGWSVSTEFFFYLLFPFILPLLLRISNKYLIVFCLALCLMFSFMPGLLYVLFPSLPFELSYTFPISRLPEFVCGMLLSLLVLRHRLVVSELAANILLTIAVLYIIKFGTRLPGYTIHNLVFVPAVMAIICVLAQAEKTHYYRWIGGGVMRYLGRISFSFYIIQIAIMLLLDALLASKNIYKGDNWLLMPVLIINLLLAAGLYELVEKRAHRFIIKNFMKE